MITAKHYSIAHSNSIESTQWHSMEYILIRIAHHFRICMGKMRIYESINKPVSWEMRSFHNLFSFYIFHLFAMLSSIFRAFVFIDPHLERSFSSLSLALYFCFSLSLSLSLTQNHSPFHFTSFSNSIKRSRIHG